MARKPIEITYNTETFLKEHNPRIYYENIDFLTVRLDTSPLAKTLNGLVENSDSYTLDHGFKVQFFGLVAGSQLKVLHVLDSDLNLVAYIHLKQPTTKKNKNFNTDIEFVGLFWKSYSHFFEYFCNLFAIDPTQKNKVTRIDYCFDLQGITVQDITKYTKDIFKKSHVIRYGDSPTYTNSKGDRHDLCLYDKKLDILEKSKHKIKVGKERPYHPYLKVNEPITRIEFRKKSRAIKELVDNSINGLFQYIRQQATDYFLKLYDLDFSEVLKKSDVPLIRLGKPERADKLFNGISDKKANYYLSMAETYSDNYTLLKSESVYFNHLLEKYGDRLVKHCMRKYLDMQDLSNEAKQIFS